MDSILGKAKPAFKLSDPSAMFEVVKHKKKTLGNSQTTQTFNQVILDMLSGLFCTIGESILTLYE